MQPQNSQLPTPEINPGSTAPYTPPAGDIIKPTIGGPNDVSSAPQQSYAPAPSASFNGAVSQPNRSEPSLNSSGPNPNSNLQSYAAVASGPGSDSTQSSGPTFLSASSMQEEQGQKGLRRFKPSKKVAAILGLVLILAGGSAAAYFGYVVPNKPENIWRTALTRTGMGYDKLSQYATAHKGSKGISIQAQGKVSGSFAADGSFSGQSDGDNGNFSGELSVVGLKINYNILSVASSGNTPDIYFKVEGLQGLGSLLGNYLGGQAQSAQVTNALNTLNNQWYFIDHSLFDQYAQSANSNLQFSSADVNEILSAVGNASHQYLFTSDPNKMAVEVRQYVGKEKQDGLSVYHYKIGVNKANMNAYSQSLCGNLVKTKLFKLIVGTSSADQDLINQCQNDIGLNKLSTSRTADAWVDLHTKLIHKIRFTDASNVNNYIDLSQNYQGGNIFPFSVATHSQSSLDSGIHTNSKPETTSSLFQMNLNMQTNTFSMNANFNASGSSNETGTFSLTVAPNDKPLTISKPANAKTIIQLLNDLGLGTLSTGGAGTPTPQ